MDDLFTYSASELSEMIRQRKVSCQEVLEAHLKRISTCNPAVNAIVTLDEEQAHNRAIEADEALSRNIIWGPLHGVPVTIKDVFETKGMRTTSSFKQLADYIPNQDATVVARLRNAGAIILGKTNTPTMAGDEQTVSPLFGRTNNPWNLERTPGGSSGGSAAAVASGMSPLDIGSDIGGSVRNPAHFCGVLSLKPSDHIVPFTGHIPPLPGSLGRGLVRQFLTPGPIARSVDDLQLALTVIAGPDSHQWESPPVSLVPSQPRELSRLRIAWCDDFGIPTSTEIKGALARFTTDLEKAGCNRVKYCRPDLDFSRALEIYGLLKEAAFTVRGTPLHLPRYVWRALANLVPPSHSTIRGIMRGAGAKLRDYAGALSERDVIINKLDKFLNEWDAWACPVAAVPAYTHIRSRNPIEQLTATVSVDGKKIPYLLATSVYTAFFNLIGNPVVVIPVGFSKDGMPIGVQIIGKRWNDMDLLSVVRQLFSIAGCHRMPSIS